MVVETLGGDLAADSGIAEVAVAVQGAAAWGEEEQEEEQE